tara:strand:+ start:4840 stop:5406 length:567 start_codon:yes stop_codon:yes gene_type:complete
MTYIITTLLGLLIIGPILYGYYIDYKRDPKQFTFSPKALFRDISKLLLYAVILLSVIKIYKWSVPLNKNHGVEFNIEREKLGIPTLEDQWELNNYQTKQFTMSWLNPEPKNGHFKKVIEYGFFNVKSENDYYQNSEKEGAQVWSTYDFDSKSFTYYLQLASEKGFPKNEILNIEKTKFELYKTKYTSK